MIDIDTASRSEQRKFGLVMAAAIVIFGLIRWAVHGFEAFPVYFFLVAIVFAVLGLAVPRALQPVFVVWIKFALVLNWLVTRILLTLSWVFMFIPVRVILRFASEDPLKRAWKQDGSYWEEPEEQPEDFDRYRNMF
jgi:hypothetical protein